MALVPLGNPLTQLDSQNYVMNLRSQDATTNNVEWSVDTQYFINDVVRAPNGGLYVYEAWDGLVNLPSSVKGLPEPSGPLGPAAGWAPFQSNGLRTVRSTSAAVTGGTAAAGLGGVAGLTLTLGVLPLGVVSTWLVKLDYTAGLTGAAAFAATEWVAWTATANGATPQVVQCNHVFGAGATTSGSPVSFVLTVPDDATSITIGGTQSVTSAVLLPGTVTATFARLL